MNFAQFSPPQSITVNPTLKAKMEIINKLKNVTTSVAENPEDVQSKHASKQFLMNVIAKMYGSDGQRYYDNTKKPMAVVNYFQDRCFNGDITQSIYRTPQDFEIRAAQFELTELQKATYFVNILEPPVRDFFFDNYNVSMFYNQITEMGKKEYD